VATHHRYATVQGHQIFYREAGAESAPAIVLLHGFPTSSFSFRDLIPILAERYHVIAPDHLGFGFSDAPPVKEFDYTFDELTRVTKALLDQLGVTRYALFVHDYGAPIGWRLAIDDPEAVTAVVTLNGNGYEEGFIEGFWKMIWDYGREQTPQTEAAVRGALSLDVTKWQYVTGVPDESLVDPDAWHHDYQLISRPGNDEVQLSLFRDYATNRSTYPALHAFLRDRKPPLLAVWGKNDPTFAPAGAEAFTKDVPDAEIHLLDAGHFPLESALDEAAALTLDFLGRKLSA